jgi:hypothetical protein
VESDAAGTFCRVCQTTENGFPILARTFADSRPGRVRDDVCALTKAWMDALRNKIARAKKQKEIASTTVPAQLAFELHAYVQEANWAYKLFGDKKAFSRAREAIAWRICLATREH